MEFSPFNNIVKLCLQGMEKEEQGKSEEAYKMFQQSWNEATNDFEKFFSAYYLARHQKTVTGKLKWLETTLEFGLKINDNTVKTAFPSLYSKLAKCYEDLNDSDKARQASGLALSFTYNLTDNGPFYHGTKANLQIGDLLKAGGNSNYKFGLKMNHIYFTALINSAGLAAELSNGDTEPRIYLVEPTGSFENDPNVTDKKFPGNPTRSYRSAVPLKIIGEVKDWVRPNAEELKRFREKLKNNKGEIIN